MTHEDFYGEYYETMKQTEKVLLDLILLYSSTKREKEGIKSIVYHCSRIKAPESMLKKLSARGAPQTIDAAINDVYDGVGIRVVCAFAEDVYRYENSLSHTRGAISMARSSENDSASSQFFIVHEDSSSSLDGDYAVFGYVSEGMDIVDSICEAAEPTDDNGTIEASSQPIITSITIRTESVSK